MLRLFKFLLFTKITVIVICYGYKVFANGKKLINVFQDKKSQLLIHKKWIYIIKKD